MHRHSRAQVVAARRTWVRRRLLRATRWRSPGYWVRWDRSPDDHWSRAYGYDEGYRYHFRRQPGRFARGVPDGVAHRYARRDDWWLEGRRLATLRIHRQERIDYGRAYGRLRNPRYDW